MRVMEERHTIYGAKQMMDMPTIRFVEQCFRSECLIR